MTLPFDDTTECPQCGEPWHLWIKLEEVVVVRCKNSHEWKISRTLTGQLVWPRRRVLSVEQRKEDD